MNQNFTTYPIIAEMFDKLTGFTLITEIEKKENQVFILILFNFLFFHH